MEKASESRKNQTVSPRSFAKKGSTRRVSKNYNLYTLGLFFFVFAFVLSREAICGKGRRSKYAILKDFDILPIILETDESLEIIPSPKPQIGFQDLLIASKSLVFGIDPMLAQENKHFYPEAFFFSDDLVTMIRLAIGSTQRKKDIKLTNDVIRLFFDQKNTECAQTLYYQELIHGSLFAFCQVLFDQIVCSRYSTDDDLAQAVCLAWNHVRKEAKESTREELKWRRIIQTVRYREQRKALVLAKTIEKILIDYLYHQRTRFKLEMYNKENLIRAAKKMWAYLD
jgi:hypothetical protein